MMVSFPVDWQRMFLSLRAWQKMADKINDGTSTIEAVEKAAKEAFSFLREVISFDGGLHC